VSQKIIDAIPLHHLKIIFLTAVTGRYLRSEIADNLDGNANVGSNDSEYGIIEFSALDQLEDRQPKPFGIGFGIEGGVSAGGMPPDIDMMHDRAAGSASEANRDIRR